ncbi:gamma-glutamyltransferase [uncultured Corynebacterium sp.]|uniref:gamma-glutamyltransferase n=1 Tax=uncultured Corynebacterium sp. TaxID=159447 RepID=UPI0025D3675B|nr:gamma-glutamyltransferase [uncultured Corynebacterium sp.]
MPRHAKHARIAGLCITISLLASVAVGCGSDEDRETYAEQSPEETQRALKHCGTDPQETGGAGDTAPTGRSADSAPTGEAGDSAQGSEKPAATTPATGLSVSAPNSFAISTPNPTATYAGCRILAEGGTAADATLAAQMMLGLTEPQSSGPGGGAISVYYDAKADKLLSLDGTVNAPSGDTDNPERAGAVARVGVPRTLELMRKLHADYGNLDKQRILQPIIDRATTGFTPSTRLLEAVDSRKELFQSKHTRGATTYLKKLGEAEEGTRITNEGYAKTVENVANDKPIVAIDEQVRKNFANDIADQTLELQRAEDSASSKKTKKEHRLSQVETLLGDWADSEAQRAATRVDDAACTDYRGKQVCGNPSPATGNAFVSQALNILSQLPQEQVVGDSSTSTPSSSATAKSADGDPSSAQDDASRQLLSEVQRIVMANANTYMGDSATAEDVAQEYLDGIVHNADLAKKDAEDVAAGDVKKDPDPHELSGGAGDYDDFAEEGTSQISVKDRYGNWASTTTTLQKNFGAGIFVNGFFLNNSLDNFSTKKSNKTRANVRQGSAHPKTMMAPLLVAEGGKPIGAVGSPGGSKIPSYVLKTVVGLVDLGLPPEEAVLLPNYGALSRSKTYIESDPPMPQDGESAPKDGDSKDDESKGSKDSEDSKDSKGSKGGDKDKKAPHQVRVKADSGLSVITAHGDDVEGASDPRRSGLVLGGSKDD